MSVDIVGSGWATLSFGRAGVLDEGSGTFDALDQALSALARVAAPVARNSEGGLYPRLLRRQYVNPDLILTDAGAWLFGCASLLANPRKLHEGELL